MTEGEYLVARMKTKDTGPYDPGHAHLMRDAYDVTSIDVAEVFYWKDENDPSKGVRREVHTFYC